MVSKKKLCSFMDTVSATIAKFDTNTIKTTIGDSTNNNRTCTISQVCRFLKMKRKTALANQLAAVTACLKSDLTEARVVRSVTRTDSFDINELIACCTSGFVSSSSARSACKLVV